MRDIKTCFKYLENIKFKGVTQKEHNLIGSEVLPTITTIVAETPAVEGVGGYGVWQIDKDLFFSLAAKVEQSFLSDQFCFCRKCLFRAFPLLFNCCYNSNII